MFLWFKVAHLFFMVCWFAGLFYLPRLFVYHAQSKDKNTQEQFKIMERKLYRFTTPFAVLTVIFGLALFSLNPSYYLTQGWFHTKITLIALLIIYHLICGHFRRKLAEDSCDKSHIFFRWFNEAPVIVLLGAIILAVIKPF